MIGQILMRRSASLRYSFDQSVSLITGAVDDNEQTNANICEYSSPSLTELEHRHPGNRRERAGSRLLAGISTIVVNASTVIIAQCRSASNEETTRRYFFFGIRLMLSLEQAFYRDSME